MTAISDAGTLFRFPLPAGRRHARCGSIRCRAGPGPASRKSNRDTEAMLVRGDQALGRRSSGTTWSGATGARLAGAAAARPAAMRRWRGQCAGRKRWSGSPTAASWCSPRGETTAAPFSDVVLVRRRPGGAGHAGDAAALPPPAGFRVTDAALLPDGRLLLLNRRFAWLDGLSATLAVAGRATLSPPAR